MRGRRAGGARPQGAAEGSCPPASERAREQRKRGRRAARALASVGENSRGCARAHTATATPRPIISPLSPHSETYEFYKLPFCKPKDGVKFKTLGVGEVS